MRFLRSTPSCRQARLSMGQDPPLRCALDKQTRSRLSSRIPPRDTHPGGYAPSSTWLSTACASRRLRGYPQTARAVVYSAAPSCSQRCPPRLEWRRHDIRSALSADPRSDECARARAPSHGSAGPGSPRAGNGGSRRRDPDGTARHLQVRTGRAGDLSRQWDRSVGGVPGQHAEPRRARAELRERPLRASLRGSRATARHAGGRGQAAMGRRRHTVGHRGESQARAPRGPHRPQRDIHGSDDGSRGRAAWHRPQRSRSTSSR
jgi:hypothetical protein